MAPWRRTVFIATTVRVFEREDTLAGTPCAVRKPAQVDVGKCVGNGGGPGCSHFAVAQCEVRYDSSGTTMKTYPHKFVSVAVVTACAVLFALTSIASPRHEGGSARLYIKRSPDLGNIAYVAVRIDGRNAGGILWARYFDQMIPAGTHTIEVQLEPAEHTYSPSSIVLHARAGQTYAFMAMKKGGALVLGRL